MKRATTSRYAGKEAERQAELAGSKRRGASSTMSLSTDHRRLMSHTKSVELGAKKAMPLPTTAPPSVLDSVLSRLRRQPSADPDSGNAFEFGANLHQFERDFYDSNTGGFDDDYVETNAREDDEAGGGGVPAGVESASDPDAVCGLDEEGEVVYLTDEDARKARNFASVSNF